MRVSAPVFRLLQTAERITAQSQGAFDVTVAPLMKCWGFVRGTGTWPDEEAIRAAQALAGMRHVTLHEKGRTVSFARKGVSIDLGGIGKGYAIDEATQVLRDCGVERALLHGGTSTAVALGSPPDADAWQVAVPAPGTTEPLAVVALKDEALSVSAEWGKFFERDGVTYGHVIDPRTGYPVHGAMLSAVVHDSATEADAWSTAMMVMDREELEHASTKNDKLRILVAYGGHDVFTKGIDCAAPPEAAHHHAQEP